MTATIEGYCDERFSAVRDVLEQQIESGADLGASFSVTYQGETVVDLWGGHLDLERTRHGKKTPSSMFTRPPRPCHFCAH